jgi:uncharacterized membrane protein
VVIGINTIRCYLHREFSDLRGWLAERIFMNRLVDAGRWFFAIGMVVFGVQYIGYRRWAGGLPPVPPWTPGGTVGAYLIGVVLVATGTSIAIRKKARLSALIVGGLFLFFVAFLHTLHVSAVIHNGVDRTRALEPLALAAAAFVLAGVLPTEVPGSTARENGSDKLILAGRLVWAFTMVIFGAQHFMYAAFIASLIPAWIPGHLFWVYFTGVGFMAAGLAIAVNVLGQLATAMLGLMFLLWVLVLHGPRVIAQPHNGDELSSLFVALATGGGALVIAGALGPGTKAART